MAYFGVSSFQESKNKQIESENHVYFLFDANGVVLREFIPQGQTVNSTYYVEILDRLRNRVNRSRKRSPLCMLVAASRQRFKPHHSARPRVLDQALDVSPRHCSPDLAPADFCLFLWIKAALNGARFETLHADLFGHHFTFLVSSVV